MKKLLAIVCVDDESVILDSLIEQLKRNFKEKNYEIEGAENAEEALEIISDFEKEGIEVALIISDQIMPGIKGDELLISLHQKYPQMIKIMLTGQADADSVGNAINQAQLYRYISKPWDETDLILTVKEALLRYKQEKKLIAQNKELEKLNASLEEKVRARTAELKKAKQAAEIANNAKSIFLANMSHELRTPLNAILGFSQLMMHSETLSAEDKKNISIINSSGYSLLKLINNILDLSQIEAGKMTLNPCNFDFYLLLKELQNLFSLKAKNKGLKLFFNYENNVAQYINTDQDKLRQVLINLINNAVKFTSQGSVFVNIKALSSKSLSNDYYLWITVKDTGVGIAEEELDQLFESFVQTKSGQNSREKGTGLGLAISQKFVQLMGGDIYVKSQLGKGTEFTFNIKTNPVKPSEIKIKNKNDYVVGIKAAQTIYKKILVVDDYFNNRFLLLQLLKPLGFQLQEAVNGREAIEIWQTWRPHLIFMDLKMPVCNGEEATKLIRELESNSKPQIFSTKIIGITAHALKINNNVTLAEGFDDCIIKPFDQEVIWKTITQYLGVKFVYQKSEEASVNRLSQTVSQLNIADIKVDLKNMSPQWVENLYQAARQIRGKKVMELIKDIPSEKTALVNMLETLAENYRFDEIVKLLENN